MKKRAPISVYKLSLKSWLTTKLYMHKMTLNIYIYISAESNIHKAKKAVQKITVAVYDRGDRD